MLCEYLSGGLGVSCLQADKSLVPKLSELAARGSISSPFIPSSALAHSGLAPTL
jgi:hypothetical protein